MIENATEICWRDYGMNVSRLARLSGLSRPTVVSYLLGRNKSHKKTDIAIARHSKKSQEAIEEAYDAISNSK